jgi:hypothetical protein
MVGHNPNLRTQDVRNHSRTARAKGEHEPLSAAFAPSCRRRD